MDKKVRSIEISKQVPIVGNYDVVVCGGGPAGFIAAIAAARSGAKTAVVAVILIFIPTIIKSLDLTSYLTK